MMRTDTVPMCHYDFGYNSICGISEDESKGSRTRLEKVPINEMNGFCILVVNKGI